MSPSSSTLDARTLIDGRMCDRCGGDTISHTRRDPWAWHCDTCGLESETVDVFFPRIDAFYAEDTEPDH